MPQPQWTVRRLLEWTADFFTRKGLDDSRLCAEQLLAHVLAVPRIKLYTDYQRIVAPHDLERYRDLVRRAADDEPVAYLTGRAAFFNLEIHVTRDVLIPRPDTEVLVENLIRIARSRHQWNPPRLLDLCTGSGCIAAAVAANLKTAVVTAVEIIPAAAAVARGNIQSLGLHDRVTCLQGDLYAPLPPRDSAGPFHLISANPPYIPTAQIAALHKSVKDFEPRAALDGGPDGLAVHRRIWSDAPAHLAADGQVLLEIGYHQAQAALAAAAEFPSLTDLRVFKDYAGRDRVIAATRR